MNISNKKKISNIISETAFSFIREDAFTSLRNILDDISGEKSFVVDPEISINLIYTSQQLIQLNLLTFDILSKEKLDNTYKDIVYLITSKSCNLVIGHMMKEIDRDKIYHIILMPKINVQNINLFYKYMMKSLIQVKLYSLPLYIMPIDHDILSIEYEFYCKVISSELNLTPDLYLSSAILQIQEKLGTIPIIQGIGNHSKIIIENILIDKKNVDINSKICRLIIIDREYDYLSLLLSQETYSGLVDETFKIKDNKINIPEHMNLNIKEKIINGNDIIYRNLRDKNIDDVRDIIINKIKQLHLLHKSLNNEDIIELSQSIKNISLIENDYPQHLLSIHFNMIEEIINKLDKDFLEIEYNLLNKSYLDFFDYEFYIINSIKENKSPLKILRIICIYCIVNNGIEICFVDKIKSLMIKNYGINCCFIFENLFAAGILFPKIDKYQGNWNKDITCVNLVNYALNNFPKSEGKHKGVLISGWGNNKINNKLNSLNYLNLPVFHVIQKSYLECNDGIILVCFVGPITHTEISQLKSLNDKIVILTTKIVHGNAFIQSMI